MKLHERDTLSRPRTRITVRTKLSCIAQRARKDKDIKFNSLMHLMNKGTLKEAFRRISASASPGIDGETKMSYEKKLGDNINNLINRLKKNSFKPCPVIRKYIPKEVSNKKRPLGIPILEDKIVQTALVIILESIYEQDFLRFSYGFRPGRSHHWIMKFLQHRIKDTKILNLIKRFLKAGVIKEGKVEKTDKGVPQSGSLSPLLGNIYLHYVLDLWFDKKVVKHCKGEAYIIRFANDSVACFQYENDACSFYKALISRLNKFGLCISQEKIKIIEFGRFASRDIKRRGGSKPETFDFLGITHYCGKSRKGRFKIKWKTSKKKFNAKVKEFNKWMKEHRHMPLDEMWKRINSKLRGHYNYYGVSDNWDNLVSFKKKVENITYKWLKRRNQKSKLTWKRFRNMLKNYPLESPIKLINLNSAFV
ncbi:MAG: group II intron reverse transcriptase/maturase [Firmicutes bacterium]|nr:group II intron reverse transcriptase/maturase [Bacillota bacterium]